jgi:iron(III) transport system permease protein
LIFVLAAAIIPPFLFLGYSSLHLIDARGGFGAFTLSNFSSIFAGRALGAMLVNSVLYPLGSAVLALVLGAAQAWLAERTDASLRQLLYGTAIISLGIPYVLYIVAWLLFLGRAGPFNALLQWVLGGTGPYIDVYSLGGMIFVEGTLWSPFAFLLLAPVLRNSDATFEEAASMCGAGLSATIRRVTFGMVRPALLALGLLVFIKASEAFEVPALVGLPGSTRVMTSTIYQQLALAQPPDVGRASAFGVLLLVVMFTLLKFYNRVTVRTHRYQSVTGKGFRPRVFRLGRWRHVAGAVVVIIPFIVVIIPLATIVWAAVLAVLSAFQHCRIA